VESPGETIARQSSLVTVLLSADKVVLMSFNMVAISSTLRWHRNTSWALKRAVSRCGYGTCDLAMILQAAIGLHDEWLENQRSPARFV
jgi:ATP-dependent Clp protease adapter protein ClpS